MEKLTYDQMLAIEGGSLKCALGVSGSAVGGGLGGAAAGSVIPVIGTFWGGVAGIIGGALVGAATFCFD